MARTKQQVTIEHVLELARQLSAADRLRLIDELRSQVGTKPGGPTRSLRGLLKDLGPAPSDEDIAEARRELWGNFPRDDIWCAVSHYSSPPSSR